MHRFNADGHKSACLIISSLLILHRLHSFSMQVADSSASGKIASAVEMCDCPPGYGGLSCEVSVHKINSKNSLTPMESANSPLKCVFQTCLPGFRRVHGKLYNGVCEPCQCHGHSLHCHEFTGNCLVRLFKENQIC